MPFTQHINDDRIPQTPIPRILLLYLVRIKVASLVKSQVHWRAGVYFCGWPTENGMLFQKGANRAYLPLEIIFSPI